MRYRTALKIWKAIGTPDEDRYTQPQKDAALRRYEQTREMKEANRFWEALCDYLGPEGRAKIIKRREPGQAFRLLMETPQDEWNGDSEALRKAGFE